MHKQLVYITTAASRQSYAWEQLSSVMVEMAMGKSAFVIGNDYTLPVMFEQLDPEYIEEVRQDPSMSPLQFAKFIGVLARNSYYYYQAKSVKAKSFLQNT